MRCTLGAADKKARQKRTTLPERARDGSKPLTYLAVPLPVPSRIGKNMPSLDHAAVHLFWNPSTPTLRVTRSMGDARFLVARSLRRILLTDYRFRLIASCIKTKSTGEDFRGLLSCRVWRNRLLFWLSKNLQAVEKAATRPSRFKRFCEPYTA